MEKEGYLMKRCLGCMQTYNNELNICPHCGYAENTTPDEAIHMVPGTILQDRFIIGKVVGCGGFGITYVAWDKVLEHKVAIKEYLPSEFSTRMPGASRLTIYEGDKTIQFDDGMDRFLDEARRLAKFQNESGIVKILDCFEENRTAYIVMEYLQGITLTQYLEKHGKISEDEAVNMILPILNSLKSVHREGIIHRDIAPDNIMVTDDGQVKLIDFGAARYATTSHSRSLTVIIKQGYSPVEQYQSRGNQGAYTDVYAIGAVLYRMITGVTPPDSMERNAYYENSRKDILDPMHKCVKGVSENRENAILNAMNIRIEDRSPDMDTLIKALTTDEPVARINGKIKKKDILQWPLWLKITIPTAMMAIIALLVLFITGVIGFDMKKPREIAIPDGMTRVPRIVSMDEESAKKILAEKKLNYIVTGAEYDSLIGEGCVLSQTMVVGALVPVNSNIEVIISAGVECYDVPYLTGISKDEAIKLLEDYFFEYEITEEYSSTIEIGYVINQSIDGGVEVEKGSTINLTISKGRNPDISYSFSGNSMPDLQGKTFEEAQGICESYGILLKVTAYEYNNQLPSSCIITQSIEAGEEISADTIVELVLSKGERIYKVPLVTYLTKENATQKLQDRGLSCSVYYEFSETVAEGYVISQSIESGRIVHVATVVELIVSKGTPKFDMIDVCGMSEAEAITALQDLGLVVTVSYEYDVDVKVGSVISQSVTKYEKAYKGCEVEIFVCSDEVLIEVPNCVGQSAQDWFFEELEEMGFVVEHNVIDEVWHENFEYGIISQTPKAGTKQKPGTTITITYKNMIPYTGEEESTTEWWEEENTSEWQEETTEWWEEETTTEWVDEPTIPSYEDTSDSKTINVWVPYEMVDLVYAKVGEFYCNHPEFYEYSIVITGAGDPGTYIVSNPSEAPDVYSFFQDQLLRIASVGAITPLSNTGYDQYVINNNDVGSVNATKLQGNIYAFPMTSDNGYYMYYDKSVISNPNSLESIIADCEAANKTFYFQVNNGWYQPSFFFATGCQLTYDTTTNKFTNCNMNYNSNAGLVALKEMISLVSSPAFVNCSETYMADYDTAVVVSGIWDEARAMQLFGDNYAAAKLPQFVGCDGKTYQMSSFSGYKLWGVKPQSNSTKQTICFEIAKLLSSYEIQMQQYTNCGWAPSNLKAQQQIDYDSDPALKALFEQNKYAVPQGQYPQEYWERAVIFGDEIVSGYYSAYTDAELLNVLKQFEADCKSYIN